MNEARCPTCRRLLAKTSGHGGLAEIKCQCGALTTFHTATGLPAVNDKINIKKVVRKR